VSEEAPAIEPAAPAEPPDRILTIPNLISIVRLACVPLFLWLLFGPDPPHRVAAAYLLAVLGATDWVDGYIARHFNQVSTLGKVLDPTADRILLATGVVAILVDHAIPPWIAIAAIVREVAVSIAVLALAAAGARRIEVQWVGKAGTFALMFAFPLFLGAHAPDLWWRDAAKVLAYAWAIPGLVLSYYAAAAYVPLARAALQDGRSQRGAGREG
jgi:cardiolipin synthase